VFAVKGRPGDKLENVTSGEWTGELKVVGATYELRTGTVKVFG
jgi:hypothetical protein